MQGADILSADLGRSDMKNSIQLRLGGLALALVSLALAALGAELVWRHLRARHYGPTTNSDYVRYDPLLGWAYRPNARARHAKLSFDVALRFDADGRRRGEACVNGPRPERPTVAFVGDSFTFGYGVEMDAAYPCLLGERLDLGVINLGVAGYATDQEFLVLERFLSADTPVDVVVLGFVRNDVAETLAGVAYGRPKPRVTVTDGEVEISPASDRALPLDGRSTLFLSLRYFTGRLFSTPATAEQTRAGRALVVRLIEEMAARTAARGAVLVVVTEGDAWLAEKLAQKRGTPRENRPRIRVLDVGPALRRADAAGETVWIPGDGHWTARGHEIVAEALAGLLGELLEPGA